MLLLEWLWRPVCHPGLGSDLGLVLFAELEQRRKQVNLRIHLQRQIHRRVRESLAHALLNSYLQICVSPPSDHVCGSLVLVVVQEWRLLGKSEASTATAQPQVVAITARGERACACCGGGARNGAVRTSVSSCPISVATSARSSSSSQVSCERTGEPSWSVVTARA